MEQGRQREQTEIRDLKAKLGNSEGSNADLRR